MFPLDCSIEQTGRISLINPPVPRAQSNPRHPLHPLTPARVGAVQSPEGWSYGSWIFRDSTLERIAVWLDEAFRVPGTQIRFGMDGIIGIVPVFGDVLAG